MRSGASPTLKMRLAGARTINHRARAVGGVCVTARRVLTGWLRTAKVPMGWLVSIQFPFHQREQFVSFRSSRQNGES